MTQTVSENIRMWLSVALLLYTVFLYASHYDWWIYGLLSGSAGLLNLASYPKSRAWRLGISAIIVFGTVEALFLTWTIKHLDNASLLKGELGSIHEGSNILVLAMAVVLTIATRLSTVQHEGLLDFLRTGLILTLALVLGPAIGYSLLHLLSPLINDVVTHTVG